MRILGTSTTCSGTWISCGAKASTNSCSSISGTGTSSIGARMIGARMICSTVCRWTCSCGLTSVSRSGPGARRQAHHRRPWQRTLCLPPGEGDASGTWPCSASRDLPPWPWPSSVLLSGATSRPGPQRRTSAHTATWSGAVALCVAGQHSSRAARHGPSRTGDTDKVRGHAWDGQPVVVVIFHFSSLFIIFVYFASFVFIFRFFRRFTYSCVYYLVTTRDVVSCALATSHSFQTKSTSVFVSG